MQSALLTINVIGLVLAIPASLLHYSDWKARHRASPSNVQPAARVTAPPAESPPPPSPGATRLAPPVRAVPAATGGTVSFTRRLISMMVDAYSWSLGSVLLASLFTGGDSDSLASDEWTAADFLAMLLVLLVVLVVLSQTGRSLGKLLVGARLERTDGRPLSFWLVTRRAVLAGALNILLITYLAALGDSDRSTLHDRITSTRVVRTR
ncbi:MAG: RDD family protein [Ilumatobacter sp.]